MSPIPFNYQPLCNVSGCGQPAAYKIGAPWSNGPQRELKNYGCACEDHRQLLVQRARGNRAKLAVAEGETVGQVGVYRLEPGCRDLQLVPFADVPG